MSKYGVFPGPHFPVFGLNKEIYEVNTGKYRPKRTPYLDTFHAVSIFHGTTILPFLIGPMLSAHRNIFRYFPR